MKKLEDVRIAPEGDAALLVEFGNEINEHCNARVAALKNKIAKIRPKGIVETVPAFCSLLIYYDPMQISGQRLQRKLKWWIGGLQNIEDREKKVIRIPVCYEQVYGPDMEQVCAHTGLTRDEVIAIHSGQDYLIYMLGFLPGFPYLGGMDPRLSTPRLQDPRTSIPAGAVGIGGDQTGIYPLSSPGGWQLIGQTPLCLYDSRRNPPILYEAGEYIRFYPVTGSEYEQIAQEVAAKTFEYDRLRRE